MGEDRFIRRVINPAIRGQNCPICLKSLDGWSSSASASTAVSSTVVLKGCLHPYCEGCISKWSQIKRRCPLCSRHFDSWFYPSRRFGLGLHRLPREGSSVFLPPRRVVRARRRPVEHVHAMPSRRRFVGRTPEEVAERKLRWRASVYRDGIRAVPLPARVRKGNVAEMIEPWIRRELQAVLGDPDPTVIVCVVSALYVELEGSRGDGARRTDDDALAPLRPFLRQRTEAFWHELTCFAGSKLTLESYDVVVEYR